jgi:multicomponent Na+:H+ antiporter subunit D
LTLFVMTRVWAEAFWKPVPGDVAATTGPQPPAPGRPSLLLLPIVGLAALTVAIGLAAEPVFSIARAAAEQLLDREGYVRAVLGGPP